jgi:hypothetical protein
LRGWYSSKKASVNCRERTNLDQKLIGLIHLLWRSNRSTSRGIKWYKKRLARTKNDFEMGWIAGKSRQGMIP